MKTLIDPTAPLRRCEDCEHHLGDPVRALTCPLFGKPRRGVEIRCLMFTPKLPPRLKPWMRRR